VPSPRLANLQILRFAAAALVVHAHGVDLAQKAGAPPSILAAGAFENFGAIGVDIFFVISGFIITRTAFQSGPVAAGTFAWRRLWRVAPIYYLLSLPWLLAAAVAGHLSGPMLAASLAFWPAAGARMTLPALDVGWTLCFEMLFYVAVAAILAAGRWRTWAVAAALAAFAACWVARVQTGLVAFQFLGNPIILEFLMGVAAAGLAPHMTRRAGWLAVGLGVFGLVAGLLLGNGGISEASAILNGQASAVRALVWGVPSALLTLGIVALEPLTPPSPTRRAMAWMGDASYALYLVHPLVIGLAGLLLIPAPWAMSGDLMIVGVFLASLAAGAATHLYLEQPLQRWQRRSGVSAAKT